MTSSIPWLPRGDPSHLLLLLPFMPTGCGPAAKPHEILIELAKANH
jgi:hypothetical protein